MAADPKKFERLERFEDVDATDEQRMFIAFLDMVDAFPDVADRRRRSYERLRVRGGTVVIDVGCGLGTAVRELAALIGTTGEAIGADLSGSMVAEAERRATVAGTAARFVCAPADALPLPAGSADAYRAERLYQHLADPGAALAEAMRCLKPGGRLVLVDQDWDACFLDAADPATARAIHRAFADSLVNGTVGRQFRRLLLDAGFAEVTLEAETITTGDGTQYGFMIDLLARSARAARLDESAVESWVADQRRRVEGDRFFMAMTHFVASAVRP